MKPLQWIFNALVVLALTALMVVSVRQRRALKLLLPIVRDNSYAAFWVNEAGLIPD